MDAKYLNPKVFSSFLIIWITMANDLNFKIFMCPIMTTQKEVLNKLFLLKYTSPFHVQFNIRFALIKSKPTTQQLLQSNEKFKAVFFLGKRTFKLISTLKYFTYITVRMATNIDASIFINKFL